MGFKPRIPLMTAYGPPLLLAITCTLLQIFEPDSAHWLAYESRAVHAGEIWRLMTGNLLHLGYSHLLLNLAGLLLAILLFPSLREGSLRYFAFVLGSLAVSLGLLWFSPDIDWYVGLSGVLHALFVAAILGEWFRAVRWDSGLFAVLLLAKLIYEQRVGPLPGSEHASGGHVVVDAHLYGAVGGVIACVASRAKEKWLPDRISRV